jgi:MFS family permease
MGPPAGLRLGIRANAGQYVTLILVSMFVGGMVGLERAVVPILAEREFGVASRAAILSFIAGFGLAKAIANLVAGIACDRVGRKPVLIAGWLVGLPVPLLIMLAPTWGWVVFANLLLGVNQGLCWSTTVIMKIDLAGPHRRGFAMGLNEGTSYIAVALAALASGYIAASWGPRPWPFVPGIVFALAGLALSVFWVRETREHARMESRDPAAAAPAARGPEAGSGDRAFVAASQAGFVNNLNDGMAWGLFPLVFAAAGLDLATVGVLAAIYPGVWGVLQFVTGPLSDRIGRKLPIVAGMWLQAFALALVVGWRGAVPWAAAMALLGAGTALVYPTLIGAVSDVTPPARRASRVGVYRLWRDLGYAAGALAAGVLADRFGVSWSILAVAALTFASGAAVAVSMRETLPASARRPDPSGAG